MRKMRIFLIILVVAAVSLVSLAAISLYLATTTPSYYQSSWINQMWQSMGIGGSTDNGNYGGMGGMMGGGGTGTTAATTSNLWIIPVAIIAAVLVGLIGLSFYMILPEIRNTPRTCDLSKDVAVPVASPSASGKEGLASKPAANSCEVILKTMTPEEQKVLNVLIAHQGKYLQKYVGKEAGLSRLKTHRIVARFAKRGIVKVKPFGNTNEVSISEWVSNSNAEPANLG